MSAAETIKKIRTNLYLERSEFAELLGITTSAVGYYETGKRIPKLRIIKTMREIAKKNGMEFSIEDFLND